MRKAFSDVDFIEDEGKLVGVCLGYDYCAEHEWGIKGIKRSLGIWSGDPKTEKKVFGFKRHKITNGSSVKWFETTVKKKKFYGISNYSSNWRKEEEVLKYLKEFISSYDLEKELHSAWDENAFVFWSPNKQRMKILFDAFQNTNILYGMHKSNNPFAGSGLIFMLGDYVTEEEEKEVIEEQKKYYDLHKRVNKTKILENLRKAGCEFYACSPKEFDSEEAMNSKLKGVLFWLNPMGQDKNNSGWYTIEELKEWINGKGPIPKE